MSKYVFDIETDGLLDTCTRCWIIHTYNILTGERQTWLEGDLGWQKVFNNSKQLIGHNIIGYDFEALLKIFDYKLPKTVKVSDTLLISQILNYKRFGNDGHSLAAWGESLGYPKVEHEDWSQYSEEMRVRCETDVTLNFKVYQKLLTEFRALKDRAPQLEHYINAEHAVAKWAAITRREGWPFDVDAANVLYHRLEAALKEAEDRLLPLLGTKTVAVDKAKGVVAVKSPRWTKKGCYDTHTSSWFDIDPYSGYEGEERPVDGEYCRVKFEHLKLSSSDDVKIFLYRHGWEPTSWNTKKDEETGEMKNTSPKITKDSLEFLKGDGKLYMEYTSASSRFSILKTWLQNVDSNNRIHGDCFTIGTPSMRTRHQIIANVPVAKSPWGKEMRQLFSCLPGWKIIGCDSVGNQARGLAHYLDSEEFTKLLLEGDVHQANADIATKVLRDMKNSYTVTREDAKKIYYAFMFGGSGAKLWSIMFGSKDKTKGNKFKKGFAASVPGLEALTKKLENIYGKTKQYGDGYIPGIAGNRIYVDSFHKLLVYLLQACEKATCSAAVMLTMERLEKEKIPYIPLIFYHDEEDFMVPEEYADKAAEIGKQSFKDGAELFGIKIMAGDSKIGNSWYEVH
jgi:hypothetical protein